MDFRVEVTSAIRAAAGAATGGGRGSAAAGYVLRSGAARSRRPTTRAILGGRRELRVRRRRRAGAAPAALAPAPRRCRSTRRGSAMGPWCPDGVHAARFDADLLRIRRVRLRLRVQVAVAAMRGPAGRCSRRGVRLAASADSGRARRRAAQPWRELCRARSVDRARLHARNLGARHDPGDERGVALVAVMSASALLLALGLSLALTTTVEVGIAANQRDAVQTLHAADAALERAIADLAAARLGRGAGRRRDVALRRRRRRSRRCRTVACSTWRQETNRLRCGAAVRAATPTWTASRRRAPGAATTRAGPFSRRAAWPTAARRCAAAAGLSLWSGWLTIRRRTTRSRCSDGGPPAVADAANRAIPGRAPCGCTRVPTGHPEPREPSRPWSNGTRAGRPRSFAFASGVKSREVRAAEGDGLGRKTSGSQS